MADQLRCRAVQLIIRRLTDFHCIIGNQAMAAFNQFERRFAFPDTAGTGNQHADTVNIHEYPMDRRCWSQFPFQEAGDPAGKDRRGHTAAQYGDVLL
ncbi:hypothetical protein D3C73_1294300 [compost metagenome]